MMIMIMIIIIIIIIIIICFKDICIPMYRGNHFHVSIVIFCTVFSLIHQTV